MTTYWRSIEERDRPIPVRDLEAVSSDVDRRDFLKAAGFSLAVVAAGCSRPDVGKAVPYLQAPEEIVPGRAYRVASTCHGCAARCGVLVKCRDGRPIKLEGNDDHPVSRGGLCATGQATVLELYDSMRLAGPMLLGRPSDWKSTDAFVSGKLALSKRVRVVSSTLASPTAARVIGDFLARFDDGRHVVYDIPSSSAIADAHLRTHGRRIVPRYRFDRAGVIVSLDADFLGTWISPVEFTRGWSSRRTAQPMSWHVQLEPRMSLTGAKADQRLRVHPRAVGTVLAHFAGRFAGSVDGLEPLPFKPAVFERIAARLESARGRSLVVSGSARVEDQIAVNQVNQRLGNYGPTIDVEMPSHQRQGSDADLALLLSELRAGAVDALFVADANPVYDLADGDEVATLLARVPLVVTFASHADETSKAAHAVCPDHHFLESWRDSEPVAAVYAVTQPAIAPLRNTRAMLESFAVWSGTPASAYDLVRARAIAADWDRTLHDGFCEHETVLTPGDGTAADAAPAIAPLPGGGTFALVLHPAIAMLDGRHAHNAWLHELPDPITKLTWDNVATLSPATAARLGIADGDVIRVHAGADSVEIPAFGQPGQHDDVVAIAIGYGRAGTERFSSAGPKWLLRRALLAPGELVGRRAVQLGRYDSVSIAKTGRHRQLASTQLHNTMETPKELGHLERPAPIRETTPAGVAGLTAEHSAVAQHDLWPGKARGPHQWAMAIDLTRCTGCSGCVIACQAENNVPVVGKDEVLREREMHWIRIDRYYSGDGDDVVVAHQPMLCHHCGNAPCETVCPVLATVHSSEGLNQQIYNRCVGTRYCANNCPYKVRRFNWFNYRHDDQFANLVLNPDVVVRSRGVMEKCSMCVQRIEEARIVARQRGTRIADGTIRTACQQSCPADAIAFGDLLDPKSRIVQVRRDPRHYLLLEELNVKPAVGYLALVRNA